MDNGLRVIERFLEDSNRIVHISDASTHRILFANKAARAFAKREQMPEEGDTCYGYLMGREKPCPFCALALMPRDGEFTCEHSIGDAVYRAIVRSLDFITPGCFIGYMTDVTDSAKRQQAYLSHVESLLAGTVGFDGATHIDVSEGVVIKGSSAVEADPVLSKIDDSAAFIEVLAKRIPDEARRRDFREAFSKRSLVESYYAGVMQVERSVLIHNHDGELLLSRVVAQLMQNPVNAHLECVLFGIHDEKSKSAFEAAPLRAERGRQNAEHERSMLIDEMQQVLKSGSWVADFSEEGELLGVRLSKEAESVLGLANTGMNGAMAWLGCLNPVDRPRVERALRDAVTGKAEKGYDVTYRIEKDGAERWIRDSGQLVAGGSCATLVGFVADITEEKLLTQEHQELLDVRDLLQAARWKMSFDDNRRVSSVRISDEMRSVLGFFGEDDFPDRAETWASLVHPDDAERVTNQFVSVLCGTKGDNDFDCEYRMRNRKGEWRWVRSAARVHRGEDGWVRNVTGVFTDVTDAHVRVEYEKRIKLANAIDSAMNRDTHSIWVIDKKTLGLEPYRLHEAKVTEHSVACWRDAGGYEAATRGWVESYVAPEDRERVRRELAPDVVLREVDRRPMYQVNFLRQAEDGKTNYHQMSFANVVVDGACDKIALGFKDVDTAVRKDLAHREVLREALQEAERANQAKTHFLNSVSHDIRTPMNAITGYTMLASGHLNEPDQVRGYLEKISTSSDHLLSLINDVLDMSRIESGTVCIEESPTRLGELVDELVVIVKPDAQDKGIELTVDMNGSAATVVMCDKLRLSQALLNILSNAVKYTNAGGKVHMALARGSAREKGRAAFEFTIRDTGIGMSEEFMEHLFEPFAREQTATVSGILGTGLGMSITKQLIEMMGGSIDVESEQGRGSCFCVHVEFELVQGVQSTRPNAGQDAHGWAAKPLPDESATSWIVSDGEHETAVGHAFHELEERFRGKRLLLAEDNELNREIATELLGASGFEVECAEDGDIAVEMVARAGAGYYDCILMDVQMPRMDGLTATRRIRELPVEALAHVPIIAMTADAFEESRHAALEAGMDAHVTKPIVPTKLLEALAGIIA